VKRATVVMRSAAVPRYAPSHYLEFPQSGGAARPVGFPSFTLQAFFFVRRIHCPARMLPGQHVAARVCLCHHQRGSAVNREEQARRDSSRCFATYCPKILSCCIGLFLAELMVARTSEFHHAASEESSTKEYTTKSDISKNPGRRCSDE
jgi:hypothetical protein